MQMSFDGVSFKVIFVPLIEFNNDQCTSDCMESNFIVCSLEMSNLIGSFLSLYFSKKDFHFCKFNDINVAINRFCSLALEELCIVQSKRSHKTDNLIIQL